MALSGVANLLLCVLVLCLSAEKASTSTLPNCDFERDFCGYTRNGTGAASKSWMRMTQFTSKETLITSHTGAGLYFLKASAGWFDVESTLTSPPVPGGAQCLEFYYYSSGSGSDKERLDLQVFYNQDGDSEVIWSHSGHVGDQWNREEVTLPGYEDGQNDGKVVFKATVRRGDFFQLKEAMLALDDITFTKTACSDVLSNATTEYPDFTTTQSITLPGSKPAWLNATIYNAETTTQDSPLDVTTEHKQTTEKVTTSEKLTTTNETTITKKPVTTRKLTTTEEPTTTRIPTTTEEPTTTRKPTITQKLTTTRKPTTIIKPGKRTRLCTCPVLMENYGSSGEEQRLDFGTFTRNSIKKSIKKMTCKRKDQDKCLKYCKDAAKKYLKKELNTPRNTQERTGDYVCRRINRPVLTKKPAKVTLLAAVEGCGQPRVVRIISQKLCCVGITHAYKRITCGKAQVNKDVFG